MIDLEVGVTVLLCFISVMVIHIRYMVIYRIDILKQENLSLRKDIRLLSMDNEFDHRRYRFEQTSNGPIHS